MDNIAVVIGAAASLAKVIVTDDQNSLLQKFKPPCKSRSPPSDDNDLDLFIFRKLMHSKRKKLDRISSTVKLESTSKDGESSDRDSSNGETKYPFVTFLKECEDLTFENQFKFTKSTFNALLRILDPYLSTSISDESGKLISKIHIALMSLWLLTSDESVDSVSERFDVSHNCCEESFKNVCDAIATNKTIFTQWPSPATFAEIITEFTTLDDDAIAFANICGIIGCTTIIAESSTPTVTDFTTELKLQCICDAKGVFLDCHVSFMRKPSNAAVFINSPLRLFLDSDRLQIPTGSYLIGDRTYPLRQYLMVPYKGPPRRLFPGQLQYNHCIQARMQIIETAFLQLKERFSKLKFLNLLSEQHKSCIEAACAIHNFCIRRKDAYYLGVVDDDAALPEMNTHNIATCHDMEDERTLAADAIRSEILRNFQFLNDS